MDKNIKAVSTNNVASGQMRYIIVNTDTGEILDNAQGYGYKTPQKAYAAYAYKTRDKSKDAEKEARREAAYVFLKQHKGFRQAMDGFCFEIEVKGSWGPDDHFDAKFVKQMLSDYGFKEEGFSASDLLYAW